MPLKSAASHFTRPFQPENRTFSGRPSRSTFSAASSARLRRGEDEPGLRRCRHRLGHVRRLLRRQNLQRERAARAHAVARAGPRSRPLLVHEHGQNIPDRSSPAPIRPTSFAILRFSSTTQIAVSSIDTSRSAHYRMAILHRVAVSRILRSASAWGRSLRHHRRRGCARQPDCPISAPCVRSIAHCVPQGGGDHADAWSRLDQTRHCLKTGADVRPCPSPAGFALPKSAAATRQDPRLRRNSGNRPT